MEHLVSNAIEEAARKERADILFQVTSKKFIGLLTLGFPQLCSQWGFSIFSSSLSKLSTPPSLYLPNVLFHSSPNYIIINYRP